MSFGSSARAEPDSPWGVSASAALSRTPQDWAPGMAAAGVSLVRGFQANGNLIELKPYSDAKLEVSGILMWSPREPLTLPVAELDGFRRYVRDIVSRYRGKVRHWEVWNEAPNGTVDTSPVSYARVVAAAYDEAKAVDPQVKIGLATKSVHLRFLAEAIKAGARDKFDYISLHPYEHAERIPQGCEQMYLGIAGNVRAMLRDVNPGRVDVPIWFTEVSLELSSKARHAVDETTQADTLVKVYTMALAQGVAHIDWFDARDSEGKHHGLQRGDGQARPAYYAYKRLRNLLGRMPHFVGYLSLTPNSLGFLFEGPTSDVVVAWSRFGESQLDLPTSVVAQHAFADAGSPTLSASPVLLKAARGSTPSNAWRKLANPKRAPWAPAPGAKEISFVAGEASPSLCAVNAPPLDSYGERKELNLKNTLGAWFGIDPSFLGYSGGAIEVVIVVRGHGNGNPGFNLKYESRRPLSATNDHGMVAQGTWSSIPGTRPLTLSFRIDDASFSGKYGANLALDCDSTKFSDFSILSLTIRKR